VFDALRMDDLRRWDGQVRMDESEHGLMVERCSYDAHRRIGTTRRMFFRPAGGGTWLRSDEVHEQTTFDPKDVASWLLRAGFAAVHVDDPGGRDVPPWGHRGRVRCHGLFEE
jgi:hypothetical protein